jgi:uncharacterized protein (DUF2141 family)
MKTLAAAFLVMALPAGAATLTVKVDGVTAAGGNLMVALCDSATYSGSGKPLHGMKIPAKAGSMTVHFDAIAPGPYAVKVMQDVNGNGKMDIGLFGPSEPYGFSNNVRAVMSAPSFDKAKFEIHDGDNQIAITIR